MAYNSDVKKGFLSRHGVVADETLVTAAEWISNIFSPLFVALIGLALMVITSRSAEVVAWIGVYTILAVCLPLLYVLRLLRQGKISDFHMQIRAERIRPMIVILACSLLALSVFYFGTAPQGLVVVAFFGVLLILFMTLVIFKWKVSGHSAGIASFAMFLYGLQGTADLPTLLLIPLVMWARVKLHRHTIMQTVVGAAAGFGFMLFTLLIITQHREGRLRICA